MIPLFKNKIAYLDYEITQTRDVGVVLIWHEVKSCKQRHGSINEAIVRLQGKQLMMINMQISLYEKTAPLFAPGYDPKRPKQLLLNKKELTKIAALTSKTWLAIILLEMYIANNRRIKAKIGIGKLRRKVEKKQILKEKDVDRQAKKEIKALGL